MSKSTPAWPPGPPARALGALEILKDQGAIKSAAACSRMAKDAAAFGKRLHVDRFTTALAPCPAVF